MRYSIVLVFCIAAISFEVSATKPRVPNKGVPVRRVRGSSRALNRMEQQFLLLLLIEAWQQQQQQQVLQQQNAQNHQWPLPLQNGIPRMRG